MIKHRYTPSGAANKPKPDTLPPAVKRHAISTTSGEGVWIPDTTYTPADTLPAIISTVTLDDDTQWVRVEIAGKPVIWHKLEYYHRDIYPKWGIGIEVVAIPRLDIGAVASYRLITALGINGEAALAVDINEHLTDTPDWFALEARIAAPVSGNIELGADVGIHVPTMGTIRAAPHVALGITITF
jgi:hypothetical protein